MDYNIFFSDAAVSLYSQINLFFIIFSTAAAEKHLLSFTVRDGDEVTLPCENVIDGQKNCTYTTWLFGDSGRSPVVGLIKLGQIGKRAKSKSDRLSVTANCSLVIKKVTVEDVGQYTCRQFRSGQQQGEGSQVYLSVINMNEQKEDDKVTLSCSVSSYDQCRHTVKWLYEGKDVDKDNKDLQTSQTGCYTTVSFLTSHHIYTSRLNLFTCEVTDGHTGKVQLFPFRLQSSGCSALNYIMLVMRVAELNFNIDSAESPLLSNIISSYFTLSGNNRTD
ncbi:hypothetical protein L3Q82_011360 [Scortum barcoo]|uniref:Uncharacterized protein n=1 Tax=Scortum barcoo TaxID=214431 RepID=A0ACB8W9I1_9TELE|nr:hypothetical protein L3Q82_011360 [Scortum barcoo]